MTHSTKHFRTISGWLCGALFGLAAAFTPPPTARADGEDNPCLCDFYNYFVGCAGYSQFLAPDPEEPPPETVVCVGACESFEAPDAVVTPAVEDWVMGCEPCWGPKPYQKTVPPPDPCVVYAWSPGCTDCGAQVTCCARPEEEHNQSAAEPCEQLPTNGKNYNYVSRTSGVKTVQVTVTGIPPPTVCLEGEWSKTYKWNVVYVAAALRVDTCTDTGKPMEIIATPTPAITPKGTTTTLDCLEFQRRWKATSAEAWPTEWETAEHTQRERDGVKEYVHTPLIGGYYQFRARNGCCDAWRESGDQTLVLFTGLVEQESAICIGQPIRIRANWEPDEETTLTCPLGWEYQHKGPNDGAFSEWATVGMTDPLPGTDDYPHVFTYTPTDVGWYRFRARSPDVEMNTDWQVSGEVKLVRIKLAKDSHNLCWTKGGTYTPELAEDCFDKTKITWECDTLLGCEPAQFDSTTGRITFGSGPGRFTLRARSTDNSDCFAEMTLTTYAIRSLTASKSPVGMGVDKTVVITATTFPPNQHVDFSILGALVPAPLTGDIPPGTCPRRELIPARGNTLGCSFGAEIPPGSRVLHIDNEIGILIIEASITGGLCPRTMQLKVTCPGDDCLAGIGLASTGLGSLEFSVGLGKGVGDRRSAGYLELSAEDTAPALATPDALTFGLDDPSVEVIRDPENEFTLRQLLAPQTLADIVVLTDFKYEIRFYHASDAGAKNEDGLYEPAGVPFVVCTIENPDADPEVYNRLRITATKDGNSEVSDFVYTAATGTWELTRGGGLRVESVTAQWDGGLVNKQETRLVKNGAGTVFAKSVLTSHQFAWGLCPTLAVNDPDGAALTTAWTYYENAAETHRYGKLKSVLNPDGSWEITDYDASGRKAKLLSSWLDVALADATDANARRIEYSYAALDPADTVESYDNRPRTVSEYIEDVLVRRTFHVYKTVGGDEIEITERAASQAAAFGDAGNLRSVVTRYPESAAEPQAQEIKSSLRPDGRLDSYTYELGTFTRAAAPADCTFTPGAGTDMRTTVTRGTAASPAGIAFKTTREITVEDRFGNAVLTETFVYTGAGYDRIEWTVTDFDEFGHPTHVYRTNGTEAEAQWGSAGCCGKTSEKDETGIEKAFGYDLLHRLDTETKIGAGAQPDLVTTFTYDAAGHQITTTRSAGGLTLSAETGYDLAGRAIAATDEAGLVTTTAYADAGRTVTVTRPGGATEITVSLLDGRTASVTGTGVVAQYHEYGVNPDGTQWSTVRTGAPDSPMYETTTTDFLGRTGRTERPAFDGSTAVSESFYDSAGRLVRTTQPGMAAALYEYDELGNLVRSGLDVNGNGTLDLASNDRINDTETAYAQDAGAWWQVTTSTTYPTANDATPLVTGTQKMRLTGFSGNVTAESVSLDIRGNATTSTTEINRTAKTVTQTTVLPTSTAPEVSITVNGLLSLTRHATRDTLYTHDALERQTGVTDPRTGASLTHYSALGQVDYTEDAAGNRTSFTYDAATGQRTATENALGKKECTSYTLRGQVFRTWGDTPYPLEYEYDGYGRMTQLKTFRGGTAWDGATWPADPGTPDVTTWTYQQSTGLLTAKTYADGNGTTYTYDAAGRLASRTWARLVVPPLGGPEVPLVTTYAYSSTTGDQTGIDYFDSTPDVTFTHTRSGQIATVSDACGTREFNYTVQMELGAETLPSAFFGDRVLTRTRDALGRDTGFLLGTAADPDAEQDVAYAYDAFGRFSSVAWNVGGVLRTATYSYLANSDLLETTTLPGNITVTRVYEPNRNLIDYVENKVGATTVSKYDYTNDPIGRRTARAHLGTAFTVADTITYGYNNRSEVTAATAANNAAYAFAYQYDPIGNRQQSGTGVPPVATNYTANNLNQYTTISSLTNPAYDLDGNMTLMPSATGDWALTWDGENRLIAAESATARLEFTYDYMSRRVEKKVHSGTPGNWALGAHTKFLYDGWNLIATLDAADSNATVQTFTWGLDLSQSLQGAGGIGGLLAVRDAATGATYWPLCDANGNVSEYLAASDNSIAAHFEYDPFGNTTLASGPHAADFAHRFSTKFLDAETGLYYYGFRYLNTELGRWVSRDPMEENGGTGLYHFAGNAPTDRYDFLGLEWTITRHYESDADARCTCGDTVDDLAQKIRLAPAEFSKWLSAVDGKGLPSSSGEKFTADRHFKIPNEAHITQGNLTPDDVFGPVFANAATRKDGYKTAFMKEKYAVIDHFTSGVAGNSLSEINGALARDTIAVWAHFGHGHYVSAAYGLGLGIPVTWYAPPAFKPHHRLSKVVMYACHQAALKAQWMALVAPGGTLRSTHSSIDPSKPDWYNLFYDSNP